MIIEYTIIDVIRIIIKKWYIILIVAVLFGIVAIPFSQTSYNKSYEHFINNTSFEYLLKKIEYSMETIEQKSEQFLEDKEISTSTIDFYSGNLYLKIDMSNSFSLDNPSLFREDSYTKYYNDISKFISGNDVLIPLFNKISDKYTTGNYNFFKNNFSIQMLDQLGILHCTITNINEEAFTALVQNAPTILQSQIEEFLKLKTTVSFYSSSFNPQIELVNEKAVSKLEVTKLATQKLAYNKTILKEPSLTMNYIKIIGTSISASVIISIFIILLIDYLKYSRLLLERINNSGL